MNKKTLGIKDEELDKLDGTADHMDELWEDNIVIDTFFTLAGILIIVGSVIGLMYALLHI